MLIQYCNGVYHCEAASNDSIDIRWVYTFYDLSCDYDAYSSVAVGDLDGDNNKEIISLVDTSPVFLDKNGFKYLNGALIRCLFYLALPILGTWDLTVSGKLHRFFSRRP